MSGEWRSIELISAQNKEECQTTKNPEEFLPFLIYIELYICIFFLDACGFFIFVIAGKLPTRVPESCSAKFSSVQSLSRVWLFATPWIAAQQASLSITNSWNLLKLMSIESVMPSNHLILCCPLLLLPQIPPSIRVFSNEVAWGGQSIVVSASESVLPMNTQDWSPLGWIGWISLQSKWLSRIFSNTTVQKHQFFGAQLSSQSYLLVS